MAPLGKDNYYLFLYIQVVNCHYEETSENSFKVKYESSKQKGHY